MIYHLKSYATAFLKQIINKINVRITVLNISTLEKVVPSWSLEGDFTEICKIFPMNVSITTKPSQNATSKKCYMVYKTKENSTHFRCYPIILLKII